MELLVALALALDDVNSLLLGRLFHGDLLKEGGELLILLNILGITVDRGGTYHL